MDGDHHRIMTGPALDRATGAKPALVTAGETQLQQALEANQRNAGDE